MGLAYLTTLTDSARYSCVIHHRLVFYGAILPKYKESKICPKIIYDMRCIDRDNERKPPQVTCEFMYVHVQLEPVWVRARTGLPVLLFKPEHLI